MAEIINTQITANADFSGLLSQVRAAITDLSALQKQFGLTNAALSKNIRTANADFSSILSNSGQFSTQFVAVSKDVEKFGKNLDAGRLKLRDYYRTWQDYHRNSNSMVKELAKQQVALQQAILQPLGRNARGQMQFAVNVPTGIDEIKNKTALANKELSIMNKVMQDGSLQLINWGKNTQWAGRQLTVGLTVPIAAFGKAAADAFRQADQELTRLTKVYGGLSATSSQELQRVRSDVSKAAKEIASGYGVSFKESIALAADIAATGKQGQDLIRSLQETTRLAVLGEVDRQEAMKATLAIQNAFRQNTDQLAESINFLNAVENQTSTTLQDLVEAIPKAGPIIQGLGGSVQDLALYLTAMKEGGVDAASAANGLKSAFGSLINPTKIAKAMFADFGIDLEGIVSKNVGNLTGTIMGLQAALDTLSPLQKQQALEQLFGKYQFARMGALFDNLGRQGSQTLNVLDLMAASTQEIGSIAERELAMVTESASGRYKRAIEGLRADLASVGEGFLDIATKLINVADGVIDFFNKLPDPVKKFLGLLGGFTAVTGPIIMLTGVFANFLGYVFKGLSHLRSFFSGAKGFKLLTPEMIAADAAAESFGKTLYSDAAAAQALKSAVDSLRQSIVALSSATPTQVGRIIPGPGRSTAAGVGSSGSIMPGANLAHFIAQARMTPDEFENQTFYHSTPYLGSINQGWGQRPQTIGVSGTPMIEGLTALKGQSTLVNPSQYARYASMMTIMAGKTKQQLDDALVLLQTTGRLPVEFLDEFDDILPSIERIAINAGNAAKEVATRASRGIITSEQAVLQIEAANRMMLAELESFALARGISPAALRMVPGTNQQIISRARPGAKPTYNMKAAFRENRGGQYTGPLATETGVALDPSAYQFRNMGGNIYMTDGSTVPGPNINADVVPAMLTPGEFVLTRGTVAREGVDNIQALHEGRATIIPFKAKTGGKVPGMQYFNLSGIVRAIVNRRPRFHNVTPAEIQRVHPAFRGRGSSYQIKHTAGSYIGDITDPAILSAYQQYAENGLISRQKINELMLTRGVPGPLLLSSIRSAGMGGSADQFLNSLVLNRIINAEDSMRAAAIINRDYQDFLLNPSTGLVGDRNNPYWNISGNAISNIFGGNRNVMHLWNQFSRKLGGTTNTTSGRSSSPLSIVLRDINNKKIKIGKLEGSGTGTSGTLFAHASAPDPFNQLLIDQGIVMANMGGMIPGYIKGGMPKFTGKGKKDWITYLFDLATARRKFIGPLRPARSLINDDPAHGPLQIGQYTPELHSRLTYIPPSIKYNPSAEDVFHRGMDPSERQSAVAWPIGSAEERAQYIVDQYVRGGYGIMGVPNAAEMLRAAAAKRSGKFYRGTTLPLVSTWSDGNIRITPRMSRAGTSRSPFPDEIVLALDKAKRTGDYSELIGKQFIMSRSSWSSNPQTARGFGDFFIESDVNNRRMVPMSEMSKGLTFNTPQGKVAVDESEFYFGGEFEIVSAGPNGMKLKSIPGAVQETRQPGAARLFDPIAKREKGGPTRKNMPYIVGEKGPELFVPNDNGKIISNSEMLRFARGGQVGRSGKTRGSETRGSEFSDYQVRGTSPNFQGMPYLPPTIMSQTFSSLVPMAQQYSAAIRMSAEKIIDAYYLAGARYQQAPEVIAKMVQSSTEKINNAYYVAGTRFQQTITNTSAAITKTLTASQVALKNYINSWTIASMRAVPQTWGELLLTRKGLLRPGGQPGSPGLLGRMSNMTGMGTGGMVASIAGSTMMMSGMNSGNRMMTAAGTALTFGPMLLGPVGQLLTKLKSTGGIAFGLLKTLKSFSIPGLVLTGALMLGKRLLDARNAAKEFNSAQASTSGIASSDVKGIAKGYESLADRIKRAREEQDAYVAAGANAYRSSSQVGVRGLTLSYQELKQAIKAVKESSPELVKDFKTLGESGTQEDITAMATRLKESFLASGMTVQEATNSVYALMKAAGLGKKAVIALGDEGFSSLQTKADVAKSSIQSLVDVTKDPLATSVQSAQALEATASVLSMTGFAVADINNNALKTATINDSIKKAIEQQVPALGKVVQVGDTFAEVLLKAKLLTSGIKLDLSSMSISNLESLAVYSESVSQATTDYINSSGMFTPLTNKVKDLNNAYAKLNSNIQTGQIKAEDQRKQIQKNYEAEKDAIQKKIDLINEEADARLKALDVAKDQADFENELKQATIEYQNAVATGNQTAAASAKLRIEQINRERQYELNRASIEEERESRIKAFQPLLDKIEKTYKAAADKIEKASTTLATQSRMTAPISNQEVSAVQADITSALQRFQLDRDLNAAVTAIKTAMERLPKELRSLVSLPEQFTDEQGRRRVATNLDQRIQGLVQSINSNIGSKAQKIFADKMAAAGVTFAEAAKMFKDAAILISGGKLPEDKSAGTRRTNVQPQTQPGSVSLSVPIQELNNSNIPTKQGQVFVGKDGLKYKIVGVNSKEGVAYVVRTMAQGGPVFGPGTGTSDSIPAMLSNGEYVVNAKAVSSVGVPFLDSINKMAMGGYINSSSMSNMSVPSYNLGGYVLSPYGNKPFGYMGGSSYSIGSKSVGSNQMTTAVFNFTFESKIHPDDRRALINETITAYKQHTKIENVRMGRSVTYSSNGGI